MSAQRRLQGWTGRRLTPGEALGLPLTVGMALVLIGGWAFGHVADNVIERDDLTARDSAVTAWLVDHRTGWLTATMRAVTMLGGFWLAVPLVVAVALLLPRPWGRARTVAFVVTVTVGTSLLVNAVKVLIARPRPTLTDVIATANGYAFPSGHTGQAVAAYGALAYLIGQRLPARCRPAVWAGAAAIAMLVGFSRLYLGVHWLTDVIGGLLIGAVWLASALTAVVAFNDARLAARDRLARWRRVPEVSSRHPPRGRVG
ncbi:MAG TPA: phosphatase PAP2 family protein [Micromonosporaceae bacterium]|nr:phosphatase PAP2 family protein [Micromonosporaceae bacterium]